MNNNCKYRKKIEGENTYVCVAFLNWWGKDAPKDVIYLTNEDCMCELYKEDNKEN